MVGSFSAEKPIDMKKPSAAITVVERATPVAGSSSRKSRRRGQKMPICEEYLQANFLLKNLAWENADESSGERSRSNSETHISDDSCPRKVEIEKDSAGSPTAGKLKSGRRAFNGPHPADELKSRKSATSFESLYLGKVFYLRNHGKRSLRPDEVFVTGVIRSKASSRRRHLPQEPREAMPATRQKPAARKPSSRDSRTTPKTILQAPAMPRSSGRTPKRR